jgi:hypothetical protein
MTTKKSLMIGLAGIALLVVSLFGFFQAIPAAAQCGGPGGSVSPCKTCHEEQDPVANNGEWHIIHAEKDICINCHGGNGTTMDMALAHQGMTAHPLSDIYTDCHSCHPDDYNARAQLFAPTLGVTSGSCATPTFIAAGGAAGEPPAESWGVLSNPESHSLLAQSSLLIVSGVLFILLLAGLGLRWLSTQTRA